MYNQSTWIEAIVTDSNPIEEFAHFFEGEYTDQTEELHPIIFYIMASIYKFYLFLEPI